MRGGCGERYRAGVRRFGLVAFSVVALAGCGGGSEDGGSVGPARAERVARSAVESVLPDATVTSATARESDGGYVVTVKGTEPAYRNGLAGRVAVSAGGRVEDTKVGDPADFGP